MENNNKVTKQMWDEVEEHWDALADGTAADDEFIGAVHCAFCRKFLCLLCAECPVSQETLHAHCYETPFEEVFNYALKAERSGLTISEIKADPDFKELCGIERDWLKALREKVEKKENA